MFDKKTQEAINRAVKGAVRTVELVDLTEADNQGDQMSASGIYHTVQQLDAEQEARLMSPTKPYGPSGSPDRYPPLNLPDPRVPKLLDVTDFDLFDSLYLGNGADGDVVLFQRPQGSSMVLLGEGFDPDLDINHTQVTTAMREPGRLGALGDGAIRVVSARLAGPGATREAINQLLEKASLQLKVCDRVYFESTLQNIYAEKPEEGRVLKVAIPVGKMDHFEVRIHFDAPLRLEAPVRLLINLKTLLSSDPR